MNCMLRGQRRNVSALAKGLNAVCTRRTVTANIRRVDALEAQTLGHEIGRGNVVEVSTRYVSEKTTMGRL